MSYNDTYIYNIQNDTSTHIIARDLRAKRILNLQQDLYLFHCAEMKRMSSAKALHVQGSELVAQHCRALLTFAMGTGIGKCGTDAMNFFLPITAV